MGGKELRLEPFIHQVGGHSPLFCLDPETVCKPHVLREHNFYASLPQSLQPFSPHFKGFMKVHISEDEEGYITLKGYPPRNYLNSTFTNVDDKPKMRLKRCGSIEIETETPSDQYFEDEMLQGEKSYNPWALKCHRDNLRKIGIHLVNAPNDKSENYTYQEYILLENLTHKYHYPCVLDLKVGTRQYGDNASSSKKQSKTAKVHSTTSGALGLRLGGMQVYQADLGRYICRNKNYGRSLTVQGLKQFFCNGLVMRSDVIRGLIRKLCELKSVLEKLDSFRFYTSSLLVTYDGRIGLNRHTSPADRKTRNSLSTSSLLLITGKSEAGVPKIQRAFSLADLNLVSQNTKINIGSRKRSISCDNVNQSSSALPKKYYSTPKEMYDFVDVRIIDFAHSTHKGLNDSTVHEGPDRGFLFGLENFIKTLREMEA